MAAARAAWIAAQPDLDPARLVFIDETGTSTNMARLRGRAKRGARLVGRVPWGHWKVLTFVAGLRHDAIIAPFVIDRAIDRLRLFAPKRTDGLGTCLRRLLIAPARNLCTSIMEERAPA